MDTVILGSQSPRRKEILGYFSIPFRQENPHFDEEGVPFGGDPITYAKILSEGKAASLASRYPGEVILSADTVVYKDGTLFAKPGSSEEAFSMLSELSGNWHRVYTAVTAQKGNKIASGCEQTQVLFHALTPAQIKQYHSAFYTLDKAGGYGIQEGGSLIIKEMRGCFYNVMGLPINTLREVLATVGIDLWEYLR